MNLKIKAIEIDQEIDECQMGLELLQKKLDRLNEMKQLVTDRIERARTRARTRVERGLQLVGPSVARIITGLPRRSLV